MEALEGADAVPFRRELGSRLNSVLEGQRERCCERFLLPIWEIHFHQHRAGGRIRKVCLGSWTKRRPLFGLRKKII